MKKIKYSAKEVIEIMETMDYDEFTKVLSRWIQ